MTQIKIKKARTFPSGEQFFPITHTKAVIDDNGYTAESRLQAMQDEINQAQLAVGAVPSDLTPTEDSTNWVTSGGVYNAFAELAKTETKDITYSSVGYTRSKFVQADSTSSDFGNLVSTTNSYAATGFINCVGYTRVKAFIVRATPKYPGIVFYDSDKNPIADGTVMNSNTSTDRWMTAKVPSNAAYCRTTDWYNEVSSGARVITLYHDYTPSERMDAIESNIEDNSDKISEIDREIKTFAFTNSGSTMAIVNNVNVVAGKTYELKVKAASPVGQTNVTFRFYRGSVEASLGNADLSTERSVTLTSAQSGIDYIWMWMSSGSTSGIRIDFTLHEKLDVSQHISEIRTELEESVDDNLIEENRVIVATTTGRYIQANRTVGGFGTAITVSNTDYRITDYIDVSDCVKIKTKLIGSAYNAGLVFYDENYEPIITKQDYIGKHSTDAGTECLIDVPENAVYLRNSQWSQGYNFTFYKMAGKAFNGISAQLEDINDNIEQLTIPDTLTKYEYSGERIAPKRFFTGEKLFDISATQGCAAFGRYIFAGVAESGTINVYDIETLGRAGTINFGSYPISNTHANTLAFSSQYYESGDTFPILYVCSGYGTGSSPTTFHIYEVRVTGLSSASIVNTITLTGTGSWTEAVPDNDNNKLWIKLEKTDGMFWYSVDLPSVTAENVTIELDNTTPAFKSPTYIGSAQGHLFDGRKIYFPAGTGNGRLYVLDTTTGQFVSEVYLGHLTTKEPEGIVLYKNHFYLIFNAEVWKLYFN